MSGEIWSPDSVIAAIERAGATWASLPGDRGPAKLKAAWPETLTTLPANFEERRDFEETRFLKDELGFVKRSPDGLTPLTEWAKGFDRNASPSASDITHADQVAGWNKYLGGRVDLMDAVWICHGSGYGPSDAAKIIARRRNLKHPPSKDMVRVAREVGIALIVRGLNKGMLPRRPADLEDAALDPAQLEAMRQACLTALEALDPFIASLAHGDPVTAKLIPVAVRHLYKAAQASAKLLKALTPPSITENPHPD